MIFRKLGLVALAQGLTMATPAFAYDWNVTTKIVMVEPSYMPDQIVFTLNIAGGTCAAGSFVSYQPHGSTSEEKQANINAVLATLLTAQARNSYVSIFGNNTGCVVTNLWIF